MRLNKIENHNHEYLIEIRYLTAAASTASVATTIVITNRVFRLYNFHQFHSKHSHKIAFKSVFQSNTHIYSTISQ